MMVAEATTPEASARVKRRTAALSVLSNSVLILLKVIAGTVTGSVAILTEAVHSSIDLVASVVAFFSVRKADEPADASHRYGHEKLEDLSAGAQAILLLIGAVFVAYEAVHRLIAGGSVQSIGIGIVVVGVAAAVNFAVSAYLMRKSRLTESPALEATAADLRTDAFVSAGVLVALVIVKLTGLEWIDPLVGLVVGLAISTTGVRILNGAARRLADETIPPGELEQLQGVADSFLGDEMVGFHDLRARHVGNHHQVDLHVQFADGTSLQRAHEISHRLQDAMAKVLPGTTALVHLEPEERVRPDRFAQAADAAAEMVEAPDTPTQPQAAPPR
jgi:cation diffusion facilitator family transporter